MNTALRLAEPPRTGEGEPEAVPARPRLTIDHDHPSASPAPRTRRSRGRRRVQRVREVVTEVEALRSVLEQAVRQYELRITAQLAEILRALQAESPTLGRLPRVKTTSAMLRAIRAVELKPDRGRAKDLVRLHELVAELTELLTPDP